MRAGRCSCSITLAMVKVLPEPVTPSSVTSLTPDCKAETSSLMASGWSPDGLYSDSRMNFKTISFYREVQR